MFYEHIGEWNQLQEVRKISYECGYCGSKVGPTEGYTSYDVGRYGKEPNAYILICPSCNNPTFWNQVHTVPGKRLGKDIKNVPQNIQSLYQEACTSASHGAYTAAVLVCRKILMNIAVNEGAQEGENFFKYIEYLERNNYLPPKGRKWIDKIRLKGNEATHEIAPMSSENASELIKLVEMQLSFLYEYASDDE